MPPWPAKNTIFRATASFSLVRAAQGGQLFASCRRTSAEYGARAMADYTSTTRPGTHVCVCMGQCKRCVFACPSFCSDHYLCLLPLVSSCGSESEFDAVIETRVLQMDNIAAQEEWEIGPRGAMPVCVCELGFHLFFFHIRAHNRARAHVP